MAQSGRRVTGTEKTNKNKNRTKQNVIQAFEVLQIPCNFFSSYHAKLDCLTKIFLVKIMQITTIYKLGAGLDIK